MEASQNGNGQNGETLEDVLSEIEVRDPTGGWAIIRFWKRSGAAGWA
jgi:hypothetical protein